TCALPIFLAYQLQMVGWIMNIRYHLKTNCMKKLSIFIIAFLAFTGVYAQNSSLGFGLKAGVNFPKYNFSGSNSSYETNSATNFHVTAFLDAPMAGGFLSVQPGISLQGKGAE